MSAGKYQPDIDNARTTKNGDALASVLGRHFGFTARISRICALVCRFGPAYARLQEERCNGDWLEKRFRGNQEAWDAWLTAEESAIEGRVAYLIGQLPTIEGAAIVPVFGGDPRGATIKLRLPHGLRGDDFGGGSDVIVPGS